jgi:predicted nucleic acid-binding protein
MKRVLLDSSFLIDLFNEHAEGRAGAAVAWLRRNPRARLWISPITYAEVLEGAATPRFVRARLLKYRWQGIGHAQAERVALRQRRARQRPRENDAWQVAVAEQMGALLLGHDPAAFGRLGGGHEDHRAQPGQ